MANFICPLMGKDWLRPMLETQGSAKWKKANKETKEKMCHDAHEAVLAVAMLEGAIQEKHGSLKEDLHQMASLGEEKYPKTLTGMNAAIGKHKWDKTHSDKERQRNKKAAQKELQLAQAAKSKKFICFCCGEEGHAVPKCPKRETIAPNDWWIIKQDNEARNGKSGTDETQHVQSKEQEEVEDDPNREPSRRRSSTKRRSATPAPRKRSGGAFMMDPPKESDD